MEPNTELLPLPVVGPPVPIRGVCPSPPAPTVTGVFPVETVNPVAVLNPPAPPAPPKSSPPPPPPATTTYSALIGEPLVLLKIPELVKV
jgi:hypothetical protein